MENVNHSERDSSLKLLGNILIAIRVLSTRNCFESISRLVLTVNFALHNFLFSAQGTRLKTTEKTTGAVRKYFLVILRLLLQLLKYG